ncbi:MAG: TonB-dependent receptor [Mucilaginibacter sp.]|uniref:SusC/RagA family TonB-linked outer membrane protein n=1 Tax=Mucilaginibacter sp. TaxID=1882438 RepID=UPI0032674B01
MSIPITLLTQTNYYPWLYRVRLRSMSTLLIFFCTISTSSFGGIFQAKVKASVVITGKVTDAVNGSSLPGVTVKLKNSDISASSDQDGGYKITVPNLSGTLIFSFIGYSPIEVPIANKNSINVQLKESAKNLNEIVVIGYGQTTKKELTSAIASVDMKSFEKAPIKSFDEALAGRAAGVQVAGNDGQPGSNSNITIRGAGSITQDISPLYIIDGFPVENADPNSINPADIESIDVLKDASATAIYGARGANGVIVITTKRGGKGDPVINYNGYYGLQKNSKTIPLMSAYEFVRYQLDYDPAAASIYLNGRTLDDYKNINGIDLQKQLYRTAPMQNHTISIRGGNDKTKYSISGGIIDQDGIIINSGFNRAQGRFTLDQNVNKKLKVGANINYSKSSYNGLVASDPSTISSASTNLLYAVWGWRPVSGGSSDNDLDLQDQLFDPGFDAVTTSDYRVNPIIDAQNQLRQTIVKSLQANGYLEYLLVPHFTLRVTGGITTNDSKVESFYNSLTARGNKLNTSTGVNGSIYNANNSTWLNENTITYKNTFNKDHDITILGGFSQQGNTSENYGFGAILVPNESLGIDGLDQSTAITPVSLSSRWALMSFLSRATYSYRSKYLFTASFRADGSSKFASGKKWGYFPSASVAWRMSNEKFMQGLTFISDSKLRFSYGQTGNNRVSDFAYLSQINLPASVLYSFNNSIPLNGAVVTAYGNPDLKWETAIQTNLGYDLSLFNSRIDITVDLYSKTTRDLLLNAQLPYTTGLSQAFKNIGSIRNQGLEFTLNTVNVHNKTFTWGSNFNISFNRNQVIALTENQQSLLSTVNVDLKLNTLPAYIATVGQPVGQMYGLIWDGVYQYSDFDVTPQGKYVLKNGIPNNGTSTQPGSIKYRDINGDGVIDAKDFTVIGRGLPISVGGFTNNFTYNGFDLNILFQWSYGNDIINANRLLFEGNAKGAKYLNQFASYADRWEPDNPSNTLFRAGGQGLINYSSRVVEDGSYLRLKTLSLGYTIPTKILAKVSIKSLRIYASAQNLYTWTKYTGPDPEVSNRNSTLTPGYDFSAYPRAKTIVFGLNVSF